MRWGWLAYKYIKRGGRRRNLYRGHYGRMVSLGAVSLFGTKEEKARAGIASAPKKTPAVPKPLSPVGPGPIPAHFEKQQSWKWDEGDLEYFRYATEQWTVHTYSNWGVLTFPAGSNGAWIYFEIAQQREAEQRGTATKGAGRNGDFSESVPVFLVFRLRDGYQESFAAVQSWADVEVSIGQDAPLFEQDQWPRISF